ncbi:MAG: hypothetical protein R6U37_07010 [Dehalococcoidia bacterium]
MLDQMCPTLEMDIDKLNSRLLVLDFGHQPEVKVILFWLDRNEVFDPVNDLLPPKEHHCHNLIVAWDYYNIFVSLGNLHGIHAYSIGVQHPKCPIIYCIASAWEKCLERMPGFASEQEIPPGHTSLEYDWRSAFGECR